ncbi:hypothetical protein DFS34DRAFT_620805 [Phlyctochytrium arcticum]|nr:hypothetical protein DFS34DRAFT_620805 [Phlyctochytrium arcticum]
MSCGNFTACLQDPIYQKIIMDTFVNPAIAKTMAATQAATQKKVTDLVAVAYGGPGMLVGVCWPMALTAFALAVWRLRANANARSCLLLIATFFQVADIGNMTYGRVSAPSEVNLTVTLQLAVVFGQVKLAFLIVAAGWRFGQVITDSRQRAKLTWLIAAIMACWLPANMTVGIVDVARRGQASKLFWTLVLGYPVTYIVPAAFLFTRQLRKIEEGVAAHASRGGGSQSDRSRVLSQLRISNNVLVGITVFCSLAMTAITQSLDSMTNRYVVPSILFLGCLWLMAESSFEVLNAWQKLVLHENTVASQDGTVVRRKTNNASSASLPQSPPVQYGTQSTQNLHGGNSHLGLPPNRKF